MRQSASFPLGEKDPRAADCLFIWSLKPSISPHNHHPSTTSTITLLVSRPRSRTTKLLRLTPPIVRHQQGPIVPHQRLLQLVLRIFVNIFLVVGHYGFGDCLADGVDLGGVSTTGDADADVDVGEFVQANDEEGFVDLLSPVSEGDGSRGVEV